MLEKLKALPSKVWTFCKVRAAEMTTKFAAIDAAAIGALQAAGALSGKAAIAMFVLVFIKIITPDATKVS